MPFTSKLVAELAEALEAVGYACTSHPAKELPSAELGSFVAQQLESAEPDLVQVVHVLTHGGPGDGDATVYALGSDGMRHPSGDIAHWLNTVQNSANRPLTLFLLDLCHAGSLARQAWQTKLADDRTRAWVIAATEGDKSAYDGRFTRALINVLRDAASGELDIDPTKEHIPLQVIAPAVRREVNRLAAAIDGYHQNVTASVVDISADVDPPFFPNPRYAPGNRDLALRASLDPGLVPFLDDLDEGLDARHFIERGSGFNGMIGCFAGREAQLKQLSPWLNRQGSGNLTVVTGSPGVGKSALLGILVCAAHPTLRARTKKVWDRAAQAPYPINDGFAAIHARQRNLAAITASLAAQLNLDTTNLIAAIRTQPSAPVIVVDALDEADNGVEVLNELLLPLSAVCRVLVGTRSYDQYQPLLETADFIVDLDDVEPEVLQEDLYRYVSDLLGATDYRNRGAVRGAFATEVAKALANQPKTAWGEFLVAGLYTRYLITTRPTPVTDATEAENLGAAVPHTLPDVLELDLAAHPDHPWLRPVLTALAHAHGQGMPASVLARAATAYAAGDPPALTELRATLDAARFYLRQATDTDHTTLYRLFHQGLADHLRSTESPDTRADLLDRLLAPLGEPRDWTAAEPYLLRHALQHAADSDHPGTLFNDPTFLLAIDPDLLENFATTPALRQIAAAQRKTRTATPTLEALARNAARAGLPSLATAAAKTLPWQPIWVAGRPVPQGAPDAVREFDIPDGLPTHVACGTVRGVPIAAVTIQGGVHFVGLREPIPFELFAPEYEFRQAALPPVDSSVAVAVVKDSWGRAVINWNMLGPTWTRSLVAGGRPHSLTCGIHEESPIAIIATDRQLEVFDLVKGTSTSRWTAAHPMHITAVACTEIDGRSIVVSADADSIRVWDLAQGYQIGGPQAVALGAITALVCAKVRGRAVAVTAHSTGGLQMWALDEPRPLGTPLAQLSTGTPTWLDTYIRPDGSTILLAPNGSSVRMWDLGKRQKAGSFVHPIVASAGACTSIDGVPTLVVASGNGKLVVRSLETAPDQTKLLHRDEIPVNRCAVIDFGKPLVLAAGVDGSVTSRNLATGATVFETVAGHGISLTELRAVWLAGDRRVVLTDAHRGSRIWDPPSGRVDDAGSLFSAGSPAGTEIAVPVDRNLVFVVGHRDGQVAVRDRYLLEARHDGPVTALAAMQLGPRTLVFSGGSDGTVQICDLRGERIAVIDQLLGAVEHLEVTGDGYLLITAGGELICGRLRV